MRMLTLPSAGLTKLLAVLGGCAVEPMIGPGGVGTEVGVEVGVGMGGGDVGVGVGVGGGDVGVG